MLAHDTTVKVMVRERGPYHVPKYQRSYTWKAAEAEEMLADLREHVNSAEKLFLGTIITYQLSEDAPLEIVDGQQRLTTIMLFLVAIREKQRALKHAAWMLTQQALTDVDAVSGYSSAPRLDPSPSIKTVFTLLVADDWNGEFPAKVGKKATKRESRRLSVVYRVFEQALQDMEPDQVEEILKALYAANVVHVRVNSVPEAMGIFERTNARGQDLEVADLLKNHLVGSDIPQLDENWDTISKRAGDGQLLRMLKYFYVSQSGYTPKAELYQGLKTLGRLRTPAGLTDDLMEFAEFYAIFGREPTKEAIQNWCDEFGLNLLPIGEPRAARLASAVEALVAFRHTQFLPLVFAALQACLRVEREVLADRALDNEKRKKIVRPVLNATVDMVELMEKFHFVNSTISEQPANKVEALYANSCKELFIAGTNVEMVRAVIVKVMDTLRGLVVHQEVFASEFMTLRYDGDIAILHYIFDRLNNFDWLSNQPVKPEQRHVTFAPRLKASGQRSWTIEHVAPQKPDDPEDVLQPQFLHHIGNLLVLFIADNDKLANKMPHEKCEILRGQLETRVQNRPYVRRFLEQYGSKARSWGAEAIEKRAREMARECYELVFRVRQ